MNGGLKYRPRQELLITDENRHPLSRDFENARAEWAHGYAWLSSQWVPHDGRHRDAFEESLLSLLVLRDPFVRNARAGQERDEKYLFVWAGDQARASADFLAVINFDQFSKRYGSVITTVPLPGPGATGNEPASRQPVRRWKGAGGGRAAERPERPERSLLLRCV
jgi:hypothetical protein